MRTALVGSGLALLLGTSLAWAAEAEREARVGTDGVLRWQDDGGEVTLFGVNYCVPFTIEYAALGHLGLDRRQVIEQDLLHLQRLGMTCLRVPVWDREISDRAGNVLENEHLALLDHLLAVGKQRGLYSVLTPMVWYATQNESPGFSTTFSMERLTTDPGEPRAVQQRFLAQFAHHRNPETGLTYAEDPAVIAFELINEPLYPASTTETQVTEYADALVDALRESGCAKPLFYNGWFGMAGAVEASRADGMTFGWYPTGLVNGSMLTNDCLPLVQEQPQMRDERLRTKARGVYEFDAADVPWPYIYPAMAWALRAGGAQFANQFQYDSWPLAASNCCWQTHFLSLPYSPGKALSLMIAGEAFRRLPRGEASPSGERLGPVRVSYEERLSELVTDTEFLHSSNTSTRPPSPARLSHVAGVGSSPVVQYDGTGAYFLERVARGEWRLEVYPDCVWLADPHARHSVDDETARIIWADRRIALRLPDLTAAFTVGPGVYRLSAAGAEPQSDAAFFAPPPTDRPVAAWHQPPDLVVEGEDLAIEATCTDDWATVGLAYRTGGEWRLAPMQRTRAYLFRGVVPRGAVQCPLVQYAVAVAQDGRTTLFPSGHPGALDRIAEVPPEPLFEASKLAVAPTPKVLNASEGRAEAMLNEGALSLSARGLDPGRDSVVDIRLPLGSPSPSPLVRAVRLRARATQPWTTAVQITLIQDDGRTYATNLPLSLEWCDVDVPVSEWWPCWGTSGGRLDPARLRELSVAIGKWPFLDQTAKPHGLELASLALIAAPATWRVPVDTVGPPVSLLHAACVARRQPGTRGQRLVVVPGPNGDQALEISHPGFGPPPDCAVINWTLPAAVPPRQAVLARCNVLRLTLRNRTPAVMRVQVGLTETDGAPWGIDLPVTMEWQTVETPLERLAFFGHWAHPEGRGGPGDRFHPERLERCTLAIGAWLNPEHAGEPHILQVARMELARAASAP